MMPRLRDHPPLATPAGTIAASDWEARVVAAADRLRAQAPGGGVVAFVASDPVESAALIVAALRGGPVVAPMSPRLPPAALRSAVERLGATMAGSAARADPAALPAAYLGRGGVAVHTSGSSGEPRAVLLTAESLRAGAAGVVDHVGLREGDRWLLNLPLHHVSGIGVVVRCEMARATVAVPEPGWSTPRALFETGATHASLVTTQLYRALREAPGLAPAGVRAVLVGGGPSPAELLDDAAGRGWPIVNSYGLTEMGSTVSATAPGAPRDERRTAGRALTGRELRVEDGEIRVGGAGLFEGYLAAGRLARSLGPDGLFATGDLGHIDDAGRLVVAGRADNRFISGGENVQPEEVEAALAAMPGVVRAVVVPVPDPEFGLRGAAYVEMEDGSAPDGQRLGAALSERLERFKVPARFHRWPAGEEGLKVARRKLGSRG